MVDREPYVAFWVFPVVVRGCVDIERGVGQSAGVFVAAIWPKRSRWWHCCAGAAVVVAGAIGGSLLSAIIAASEDGVAPEDYDSGDRFALLGLFAVVSFLAVAVSVLAFAFAWVLRRSPRKALFATCVGLSPSMLAVAVAPLLWT